MDNERFDGEDRTSRTLCSLDKGVVDLLITWDLDFGLLYMEIYILWVMYNCLL